MLIINCFEGENIVRVELLESNITRRQNNLGYKIKIL